jgi:hypothetical protein
MCISQSFAQKSGKLAQVGMAFLDIPVGTRATGMGEAYVSIGDDANAVFWNPAGIALIENGEFIHNHNGWIADITHISAAAAYNLGTAGVIGLSVITMDYGDIPGTQIANNEQGYISTGNINVSEIAVGLTYAQRVSDRFSYGITAKYVYQDLGKSLTGQIEDNVREIDNTLGEFAFDFGTLFYTGFHDLRIAMSARNFSREIGYHEEKFPLPLTFSFGLGMNIMPLLDIVEDQSLTVALDALHPRDYPERINFGLEYWYMEQFAARLGYKFITDEEGFTAGLGVKTALSGTEIRVDYSFNDFGLFDPVHRFSVGFAL